MWCALLVLWPSCGASFLVSIPSIHNSPSIRGAIWISNASSKLLQRRRSPDSAVVSTAFFPLFLHPPQNQFDYFGRKAEKTIRWRRRRTWTQRWVWRKQMEWTMISRVRAWFPWRKKAIAFWRWDFLIFVLELGSTLQGTNISPKNGILKMIFLFPRWDMLIPWSG